jgi:hypothetical protein
MIEWPCSFGEARGNELIKLTVMSSLAFVFSVFFFVGQKKSYEGATIAEFDPKTVALSGCTPIMLNSRGGISVILREPKKGCGQVIVDGAFTKLYIQWDAAGSDRFVRNCACYLAADMSSADPDAVSAASAATAATAVTAGAGSESGYDYSGCLEGVCDITFEEGPVAVLASEMAEADLNTSDFALDDPLSMGKRNARVLGTQAYDVPTAKRMLVRWKNWLPP